MEPSATICNLGEMGGKEGVGGRGGVREVERRANYTLEICSLKMVL